MSTETQTEATGTQLVTTEEKGQQAFSFVESVKPGRPKKKTRMVTTPRGRELAALGRLIADARKKAGMTQAALATLADVSAAALAQVETGTSGSQRVVTNACAALNIGIPASAAPYLREGPGRVTKSAKGRAAAAKRAETKAQAGSRVAVSSEPSDERRESVLALLTLVRTHAIETGQALELLLRLR